MNAPAYGQGNATFMAAGGEAGICRLVDSFYDIMGEDPRYDRIWHLHGRKSEISRDKLARFLCGWMGGPMRYQSKYGPINIPMTHARLNITEVERDLWLSCMQEALNRQDYPDSLITYLMAQFAIPAERIRYSCANRQR